MQQLSGRLAASLHFLPSLLIRLFLPLPFLPLKVAMRLTLDARSIHDQIESNHCCLHPHSSTNSNDCPPVRRRS